jgi:hypothetical protein
MTIPLRFVSMCAALGSLVGYLGVSNHSPAASSADVASAPMAAASVSPRLYPGTVITVRLDQALSSEKARRGQHWVGVIASPVVVNTHLLVPRGSRVEGEVVSVRRASDGTPGIVHLTASSVIVDGRETALAADAGPVIAGTARAINLGASDGGDALADADVGSRDDAVDGLRDRAGEPLVLRPGTVMGFMLNESVLLR